MEKQAVITATDLCIGYRTHKGEKKVHEHLSFGLYPGELTSLLGANGAGKSTLLRTLSASQPSLAGDLQAFAAVFGKGTFAHHRRGPDRQDTSRRADRV